MAVRSLPLGMQHLVKFRLPLEVQKACGLSVAFRFRFLLLVEALLGDTFSGALKVFSCLQQVVRSLLPLRAAPQYLAFHYRNIDTCTTRASTFRLGIPK